MDAPPARTASALHHHATLPASVRSALWLAHQLGSAHAATVSSGFDALDATLPGGGWPLAGLAELMPAEPGGGEMALLAPALARLSGLGGEVVWIAPPHIPFAPALQALGLHLSRFTWVMPAHPRDAAWAAEQALRSGTCAWVQWWSDKTTPEVLRRLHLAALDHHCPLLVVRPRAAQQQASPAPLRLACTPLPGRHLSVQVLKRRGPAATLPVVLALPDPVPPRQRRHQPAGRPLAISQETAGDALVAGQLREPFPSDNHALAGPSSSRLAD